MVYNAFMSYSHAVDGRLAPALHSALHRFARPWYRLRALRVFRDKTNLPVTPRLWSTISAALDQAPWFILLASPGSAASPWVRREVEHWLGRHTPERLLIVLTDGTLAWDPVARAFDRHRTDALPEPLLGAFAEEPLYLDLRWARQEVHLSAKDPRFQEAVAELAAALHGRPKDELVGEDVRQHRRAQRLARGAVAALALLTLASIGAAVVAVQQRNAAEVQRAAAVAQGRIALARQLAAQSTAMLAQFPDRLSLAVLLALESTGLHPASFEGSQALRAAVALLPAAAASHRPAYPDPGGRVRALAFSPDGAYLAVAREAGVADLFDLRKGLSPIALEAGESPDVAVELAGEGGMDASLADDVMHAVAFSPDGSLMATAGGDGAVRLHETASGRERLRAVHGSAVVTLAFDPTGTRLATGTRRGTLRILDARTGQVIARFAHGSEVRAAAFSPDGRHLAAITTGGEVLLVDAREGRVARRWGAGDAGLGLAFSADGRTLATAGGSFASVRDVATGKALLQVTHAPDELMNHLRWIDAVALAPGGTYLATAGREGTARVWHLTSGLEVVRLRHGAAVWSVAFGPGGTLLATASADGTARLWEIPSGRERLRAEHDVGAEAVAFSPDGTRVASAGSLGDVQVWGLARGDQAALVPHAREVRAVAVAPDGRTFATGDAAGVVRRWTIDGHEVPPAVTTSLARIEQLVFAGDGRHLAARRGSTLILVDPAGEPAVRTLADYRSGPRPALGARYLAAWDPARRAVRLWETAGGRELAPLGLDDVDRLVLDAEGRVLVTVQMDRRGTGALRVWALPAGSDAGLAAPITASAAFAVSPGGRRVAVSGYEREPGKPARHFVDVLDVAGGARVARIAQEAPPDALLLDGEAGSALVVVADREVRILDLPSGSLRARLGHEERVEAIRLDAGADVVATAAAGRVYLWNRAGALLGRLDGAGSARDVRLAPGARHVVTAGADGAVVAWRWRTEDLRAEACRRLARNLSADEWQYYLPDLPRAATCPGLPAGDPGAAR